MQSFEDATKYKQSKFSTVEEQITKTDLMNFLEELHKVKYQIANLERAISRVNYFENLLTDIKVSVDRIVLMSNQEKIKE